MQFARNRDEDLDGAGGWLMDKQALCTGGGCALFPDERFPRLVQELDMYGFVRVRVVSNGRYGRTTQITPGLPKVLLDRGKPGQKL